ncbi:nucleotide-diphospho-sugar transferase [Lentinus tigrinus ALCF2SS1-7]|uniref:nucleotide-diphospho-sugar transferase n=1 Tax=Lentinus tigrinus ALCF2SS1-7 TaxID=1328758 RepID=UPI0011663328|nr:nucleotide-diphospho-sugar transferase [Lentinus tigrinus ALCF2SS1-7]
MSRRAYVTLLTAPGYLPGVLVLHDCLVSIGSQYPLVVMATPSLSPEARAVVAKRGILIRDIDHLYPEDGKHVLADHDARFRDTWTKLKAFELVEYERVVMLDADMIVMRNMDHLLEMELEKDWIAAAHVCACNPRRLPHYPDDWKPENCAHTAVDHPTADPPSITASSPRPYTQLNSGTVVLHPSSEVMQQITNFISTSPRIPTYSFPDQDLLSDLFQGRWKPLSWRYNALKTLRIIHPQLWRDQEIHCLHYILHDKPWKQPRGTGGDYEEVNSWWWDRYEAIGREMEGLHPEDWNLVDAHVTHG